MNVIQHEMPGRYAATQPGDNRDLLQFMNERTFTVMLIVDAAVTVHGS